MRKKIGTLKEIFPKYVQPLEMLFVLIFTDVDNIIAGCRQINKLYSICTFVERAFARSSFLPLVEK